MKLFGWNIGAHKPEHAVPRVTLEQLNAMVASQMPDAKASPIYRNRYFDGEKYPGGYGATDVFTLDYWALRARSSELWHTNLFARGLVRCIVDNEINTGLHLEATPREKLLGLPEDGLAEWAEDVETRFELWGKDPVSCDYLGTRRIGKLQKVARAEAILSGDLLVVLIQDQRTKMPRVQLISGNAVRTPIQVPKGKKIVHGVELDDDGRHVAFWVRKQRPLERDTFERLPAYGPRTGRRQAWLVYGSDNRLEAVRGEPLLAQVLQSLKEIDRYRDATLRKAVLNAMLALIVTKSEDKAGSSPLSGGAVRKGTEATTAQDDTRRTFDFVEHLPGMIIQQLQQGEDVRPVQNQGTDEKFGDFSSAQIAGIGIALRIPPEILEQAFSSNYSASQAAINEYKLHLNAQRDEFGSHFMQPIYQDWLLSAALVQMVDAGTLLEAWRDPMRRVEVQAWWDADWTGHIKPAVKFLDLVKGAEVAVANGFLTRDRAARELTGTKYSQNVAKLARENEALAKANEILAPPAPPQQQSESGDEPDDPEDREEGEEEASNVLVHPSRVAT